MKETTTTISYEAAETPEDYERRLGGESPKREEAPLPSAAYEEYPTMKETTTTISHEVPETPEDHERSSERDYEEPDSAKPSFGDKLAGFAAKAAKIAGGAVVAPVALAAMGAAAAYDAIKKEGEIRAEELQAGSPIDSGSGWVIESESPKLAESPVGIHDEFEKRQEPEPPKSGQEEAITSPSEDYPLVKETVVTTTSFKEPDRTEGGSPVITKSPEDRGESEWIIGSESPKAAESPVVVRDEFDLRQVTEPPKTPESEALASPLQKVPDVEFSKLPGSSQPSTTTEGYRTVAEALITTTSYEHPEGGEEPWVIGSESPKPRESPTGIHDEFEKRQEAESPREEAEVFASPSEEYPKSEEELRRPRESQEPPSASMDYRIEAETDITTTAYEKPVARDESGWIIESESPGQTESPVGIHDEFNRRQESESPKSGEKDALMSPSEDYHPMKDTSTTTATYEKSESEEDLAGRIRDESPKPVEYQEPPTHAKDYRTEFETVITTIGHEQPLGEEEPWIIESESPKPTESPVGIHDEFERRSASPKGGEKEVLVSPSEDYQLEKEKVMSYETSETPEDFQARTEEEYPKLTESPEPPTASMDYRTVTETVVTTSGYEQSEGEKEPWIIESESPKPSESPVGVHDEVDMRRVSESAKTPEGEALTSPLQKVPEVEFSKLPESAQPPSSAEDYRTEFETVVTTTSREEPVGEEEPWTIESESSKPTESPVGIHDEFERRSASPKGGEKEVLVSPSEDYQLEKEKVMSYETSETPEDFQARTEEEYPKLTESPEPPTASMDYRTVTETVVSTSGYEQSEGENEPWIIESESPKPSESPVGVHDEVDMRRVSESAKTPEGEALTSSLQKIPEVEFSKLPESAQPPSSAEDYRTEFETVVTTTSREEPVGEEGLWTIESESPKPTESPVGIRDEFDRRSESPRSGEKEALISPSEDYQLVKETTTSYETSEIREDFQRTEEEYPKLTESPEPPTASMDYRTVTEATVTTTGYEQSEGEEQPWIIESESPKPSESPVGVHDEVDMRRVSESAKTPEGEALVSPSEEYPLVKEKTVLYETSESPVGFQSRTEEEYPKLTESPEPSEEDYGTETGTVVTAASYEQAEKREESGWIIESGSPKPTGSPVGIRDELEKRPETDSLRMDHRTEESPLHTVDEEALDNVVRMTFTDTEEDIESPEKQSTKTPSSHPDEQYPIAGDEEWKVYDNKGEVLEEFSNQLTEELILEAESNASMQSSQVPITKQDSCNEVILEHEVDYQSDLQEKLDILAGERREKQCFVQEGDLLAVIDEAEGEHEHDEEPPDEEHEIRRAAYRLVDDAINAALEPHEDTKTVTSTSGSNVYHTATEHSKDDQYDTCVTSQDTYDSAQEWTSQDSEYTTAASGATSRLSEAEERLGSVTPLAVLSPVDSDRQFTANQDFDEALPIRHFNINIDDTARSTPDVALQVTIEEEEEESEATLPTSPSGVLLAPYVDPGRPVSPVPPRRQAGEDDEFFVFLEKPDDAKGEWTSSETPERKSAERESTVDSQGERTYSRQLSDLSSESHADTVIHHEKGDTETVADVEEIRSTYEQTSGSLESLDKLSARSSIAQR
ncbi:unnamed protein product [Heligmosomoides polygyrus]|uniref:Microtubule-associated protein n=1 Tax=Heligmosomoides polygyrus TaxID=6339 RepID=A0A183GA58_HELPZ|nr:unnamed protein product [Heligmosomoides polygyrus]